MEDNTLSDIKSEGEIGDVQEFLDSINQEETETPEDTVEESKTNEETESPSQEGEKEADDSEESSEEASDNTSDETKPVPFHEHPRWIKKQEETEALRIQVEALTNSQTEIKETIKEKGESNQMPQWFTTLAGDDDVALTAWNQYQAYDGEQRKSVKTELLAEQKLVTDKQAAQEKWVEDEIAELKSKGYDFKRNELMKVAIDFKPLDESGNISFKKAYEILALQKNSKDDVKAQAKKTVAAKTTSDNRGSAEDKKSLGNSNYLRSKSMADLIAESQ